MIRVGKHLVRAALALFLASWLVFSWQALVPASPTAPGGDKPPTAEELRRKLAQGQPESYSAWLSRMLNGELGASFFAGEPAAALIAERSAASLQLILMAIVLAVVVGGGLGEFTVTGPPWFWRGASTALVALASSLPHFVLALVLVLMVLADAISLPLGGYVPFAQDWQQSLVRTILPAIALAAILAAVLMRDIHERAQETGDGRRSRTAATIAHAAVAIIGVVSGLVIVETIFAIPGLGRLLHDAVMRRDFPVLMPVVLLAVAAGIALMALADIVGALINPRPRPAEAAAADAPPAPELPVHAAAAPRGLVGRVVRNGFVVVGLVLVVLFVVLAVAGPSLAPHDPMAVRFADRLRPPTERFPLGTDALGRDVLSRLLHGTGPALLAGIAAIAGAVMVGLPLGLMAGYAGRHAGGSVLDVLIMAVMDTMLGFPVLVLAVALAAVFGPGFVTTLVTIVIAATPIVARLARDHALGDAVSLRRGLPGRLAAQAASLVAAAIATFAAVDYLGLGMPPPAASWGAMAHNGTTFAEQQPGILVWPLVAIGLATLSFNLIAAGLRYALDAAPAPAAAVRPRA